MSENGQTQPSRSVRNVNLTTSERGEAGKRNLMRPTQPQVCKMQAALNDRTSLVNEERQNEKHRRAPYRRLPQNKSKSGATGLKHERRNAKMQLPPQQTRLLLASKKAAASGSSPPL